MYIIFSFFCGFIQISQIATDIAIYKVIHTGAKTQSDGLNEGFVIVEYQGSLYILVTKLPHAEAPKARILNINREIIFLVNDIIFKLLLPYLHQLRLFDQLSKNYFWTEEKELSLPHRYPLLFSSMGVILQ